MNKNIMFPDSLVEVLYSKLEVYDIDNKKISVWKSIATITQFGDGVFELSSSEQLQRGKHKLNLLVSGKKTTELKIKVVPTSLPQSSEKKVS